MKKEFINLFCDEIGFYMFNHVDQYDYSKGMEGMGDDEIAEIAGQFFDLFYDKFTDNEIREALQEKYPERFI